MFRVSLHVQLSCRLRARRRLTKIINHLVVVRHKVVRSGLDVFGRIDTRDGDNARGIVAQITEGCASIKGDAGSMSSEQKADWYEDEDGPV